MRKGTPPRCPSISGRWNSTRILPWPTAPWRLPTSNLNEVGRGAENARKAYELREKVSERERFLIEADYYFIATGELEKAAQTYELWQQTYPRDYRASSRAGRYFLAAWETGKRHWRKIARRCAWSQIMRINYTNLG